MSEYAGIEQPANPPKETAGTWFWGVLDEFAHRVRPNGWGWVCERYDRAQGVYDATGKWVRRK